MPFAFSARIADRLEALRNGIAAAPLCRGLGDKFAQFTGQFIHSHHVPTTNSRAAQVGLARVK